MIIQVTDEDIKYTEKILLPENSSFDDERKEYIKNFETIDLQAVPGSGKTTLLLAKLLILEKYLPFGDGSGILVISHTNAAVDEISRRIGLYCNKLFNYPNFVGTIQSFVDKFLTIPFYKNEYKKSIIRIDDEIYQESVYIPQDVYFWLQKQKYKKNKILYTLFIDENDELDIEGIRKGSKVYCSLCGMKKDLRDKGILSFQEAYIFAKKYIYKYPLLKRILQNRFKYVFVDEMQDMDKNQFEVLENIFFDEGHSGSIYQRIGDRNQSIFSEDDKNTEVVWNNQGRKTLHISGSYRFSQEIADVVKCFASDTLDIKGKSSHTSLKPHLMVYNQDNIDKVLPKFVDIIKQKQSAEEIPSHMVDKIKAIGWRKRCEDRKQKDNKQNKISIKDYWPEYDEKNQTIKIDYVILKDYLTNTQNNRFNSNSLKGIRENILNALLKVLRLEGIRGTEDRHFTKKKLLDYIKNTHNDFYEDMKLQIYLWSIDIYKGYTNKVYNEIKEYIPRFLNNCFEKSIKSEKTSKFVINNKDYAKHTGFKNQIIKIHENNGNVFECNGLRIEVGTVHSVKGETHFATLYMETFFNKKCESYWLKEYFKGKIGPTKEKVTVRKALKVAYVGMSRPKYLLCVAVNSNNIKDYLCEVPDDKWEKVWI